MAWWRRAFQSPESTPAAKSAEEWKRQGNTALAEGRLDVAAHCYEQGVLASPQDASLRLNFGFALLESGRASAAAVHLEQALAQRRPDEHMAHEACYLLARVHRALHQPEEALARLTEAVAIEPGFTPAMQEAVALLHEQGRDQDAMGWAQRWAGAEPSPPSLLALAHAAYASGSHDEALRALDALLVMQPGSALALEGRASVRLARREAQQALADFDAALRFGGTGVNLTFGRAKALRMCGRSQDSLDEMERVLAADPRHRDAHIERSGLLAEQLRMREAVEALEHALRIFPDDPDLRWLLATARLLGGDMEQGWIDYEVRHHAPSAGLKFAPPDYGVPHWTGVEDLRGESILVVGEQGLGDAIQFARYLPLLQRRGASVTFNTTPVLHSLFQDAFPGIRLIDGGHVEKPKYQCLLLSLPLAFRTSVASVPAAVPYLRSRTELRSRWEERLGARRGLRVGLVWSGGASFGNDAQRSIPLERLRAIDVAGVQFVSLQKEVRESDRAALASWPTLSQHGAELHSFADTAALAELVDVVVSVDTSVAHLAGALGRPLWMLLPHLPDWRWMLQREDSPWYPTARLFRQPVAGDWDSVLARVRDELRNLAATAPA